MKSPIDPIVTAHFFTDISEKFDALQRGFSEFRDRLKASGEKNRFFNWKVSDLAENRHSFELRYLTMRVRAVFSIRPTIDLSGVITFYRLEDFDTGSAVKIDFIAFDAEDGATGIRNAGGAELSIVVERQAVVLMVQVLRQAFEGEADAL